MSPIHQADRSSKAPMGAPAPSGSARLVPFCLLQIGPQNCPASGVTPAASSATPLVMNLFSLMSVW